MQTQTMNELEFLYGAEYNALLEENIYPTGKQLSYIIDLMTKFEKMTTRKGIVFPYKNEYSSLLETREKFVLINKNKEVGVIIDCLNELLVNIGTYDAYPTVERYEQINQNLNVLNRYFVIKKLNKVKAEFKSQISEKQWKEAKKKEELFKLEKERLKKQRMEEKAKKEWIKDNSPKDIGIRVFDAVDKVEKEFKQQAEVSMISLNQRRVLMDLIPEALAFIRMMNKDGEHFNRPYTLSVIHFMTFGEAGSLMNVLKSFCGACWRATEKKGDIFEFKPEKLLTPEFISMLSAMGEILPYVKESLPFIDALSDENDILTSTHLKKMEERLKKIASYSELNDVEKINIAFSSVFEKRCFLARFHTYLTLDYKDFDLSYKEDIDMYDIVGPFLSQEDEILSTVMKHILDNNKEVGSLIAYAEGVMEQLG